MNHLLWFLTSVVEKSAHAQQEPRVCQIRPLKRVSGRNELELDPCGTNDLGIEEVKIRRW